MLYGLSVAYFRAGRYSDAISTAKRAQRLASTKGRDQLASSIQKSIELFNKKQKGD